jgi:hypothetical protein
VANLVLHEKTRVAREATEEGEDARWGRALWATVQAQTERPSKAAATTPAGLKVVLGDEDIVLKTGDTLIDGVRRERR